MKNISIILILLLITIPGIAKVNSTPSSEVENSGHFQTVWSGNGINHMNINIVEATLSGFNLKAGDEIAAFDGSLCVGVVRLTAPFTSSSIAASQSTDGLPNGYTIGHPITLKFWDAANNKERSPVDIFNSSKQPISPIFSDKGSVSVRLSAKTELTIQITPDNKTYDGTTDATVPNASVVLTNLIAGHNVGATISNAKFDTKNAGTGKTVTADVTLTGTDAAYYSCNATVSSTANILAKAITLTADNKSKTYGDSDPAFTAQVTSGSIVSGDIASGALNRIPGTNAGDYAINKGTYSYGNNYTETFIPANLNIGVKTITVTADTKNKIFGDADPTLTYTFSPTLIGTDTFTGSLSRTSGENVGTYTINKNSLALSTNYSMVFNGANLTISAKTINVKADAKTKTFRDVDPPLTYTFTPALVGTDAFTGSLTRAAGENSGSYNINKNDLALNNNYTINYTGANFTIAPQVINVTADAKTKTYGDNDPNFTFTYTPALLGNDTFTGSLSRSTGENVGSYSINKNDLSLNNNYTINYTGASLTIEAKTINVIADIKSKTFGDADPVLTYTYNYTFASTLIGTDAFTGSLARTQGENAGEYDITIGTLTMSNNYIINFTGNKLTIGAKTITITADAKSKIYGDVDPVFTYTFNPALIGSDRIMGLLGRTAGENVGTYTFSQGTLSAGNNYIFKILETPVFTITPKNLTVTGAVAQNKIYDGTNTAQITGAKLSGIVGSDLVALANHTAGIFAQTGIGIDIAVATLPMTLTGLNATNYTLIQPTGLKANITTQAPVANAGTDLSVDELNTISLDGSASSDPDNDKITYLWTAPNGVILSSRTEEKPTLTAPEVLVDTKFTISLVVNDGTLNSIADEVVVTVKQVNKPPKANAGSDQIIEENSKVTLSGLSSSDPEKSALVYTWVIPPGITVADNNIANIEFTAPEVTDLTTFTFTLIVSDGYLITRDIVVITVHNVNKKPVANAGSAQTVKEGATVTLDGSKSSDPDGNTLSYSWVEPAGIQLAGKFTATPKFVAPELVANGTYLFKLIVNDGLLTDESTVEITVENVNKAPIANAGVNQSVKAGNLVQLDGSLSKDPDNDNISYLWTAPNGIALSSTTIAKPSFTAPTVTADKEYILTLIVNDGKLNSIADSIIVTVNYENAKPVAINQQLSLNEDDQIQLELKATDDKPVTGLTYKVTKAPLNGVLTSSSQNLYTYKPKADYYGSDKFEFEVKDVDGKTDVGTILIDVKPINDKPTLVLSATNFPLEQGSFVNVQLKMDDTKDFLNAADMKLLVVTQPVSGRISGTIEKGSFTYTPVISFSGIDFMQVEAQETNTIEGLKSTVYTIFFSVSKTNQPPVAFDQNFTIQEDSIISLNLPGTDPEDGTNGLTYSIVQTAGHGQIELQNQSELKYTPVPNYYGYDELRYVVRDKEGVNSNTAKISFFITPVNDRPTAESSEFSAQSKDSILIDMAPLIADIETSDNLLKTEFQLGKGVLGGTITKMSGTTYKYKKATNTKSYDYLLYKVSDENLSSYAKIINIKDIGSLKSAKIVEGTQPIAVGDTVDVWYNKPLSIEFIGIDPSEPYEKLKVELVAQPKKGTITGLAFQSYDQSILTTYRGIYTATENKNKLDSVEYKVSGADGQSIGKLYFKIHASDVAPKLQSIANQTIEEDTEGRVIVVVDDPDSELTSMYWEVKNAKATGFQLNMTIIDGKETFIVTPPLNYHGTSQINIIVTDPKQLKDSVQFMLTVKPLNDAPSLISEKIVVVNEDESFQYNLMGNDVDGDAVEFAISNLPTSLNLKKGTVNNAILSGTAGNELVGDHQLNLILTDGRINSPVPLTLRVINTDDPPYLKTPIEKISGYRNGASKTIDLSKYLVDDDLGSVYTYSVVSNTNNLVVTTQITGNELRLDYSKENYGNSTITVMITSDGKSAQTSFDIEVLMNTGINDLTSDVAVEVFPNPTKGNVNIQFTEVPQKGTRINILDMAGRLIRTQAANSDKEFIDLQGNKSGVYFIQIKNEQHAKTYKIILE